MYPVFYHTLLLTFYYSNQVMFKREIEANETSANQNQLVAKIHTVHEQIFFGIFVDQGPFCGADCYPAFARLCPWILKPG